MVNKEVQFNNWLFRHIYKPFVCHGFIVELEKINKDIIHLSICFIPVNSILWNQYVAFILKCEEIRQQLNNNYPDRA